MEGTNEKPWHGLGEEIDANLSPHEMLVKAKLDYKRPYKSPANHETFRFFKAFAEAGESHIQTVGQLDKGRIIWALAGLNATFSVKGVDPVEGCLLFASRDEKRDSVHMLVTAVRGVCGNTLQVASEGKSLFKNTFRRVFISRPPFLSPAATQLDDKITQKAKENISLGREAIVAFASNAERLADQAVDDATAHRYMLDVFQPEVESSVISQQEIEGLAEKNTLMAIEAITKAPGQDLESADMTAWGLLNAVTYTVDYRLGKNQDSRLRLAWFGSHADIKKRAFDLALKLL
jgi:phage/plasmid-like protein (TIGR03299 family)